MTLYLPDYIKPVFATWRTSAPRLVPCIEFSTRLMVDPASLNLSAQRMFNAASTAQYGTMPTYVVYSDLARERRYASEGFYRTRVATVAGVQHLIWMVYRCMDVDRTIASQMLELDNRPMRAIIPDQRLAELFGQSGSSAERWLSGSDPSRWNRAELAKALGILTPAAGMEALVDTGRDDTNAILWDMYRGAPSLHELTPHGIALCGAVPIGRPNPVMSMYVVHVTPGANYPMQWIEARKEGVVAPAIDPPNADAWLSHRAVDPSRSLGLSPSGVEQDVSTWVAELERRIGGAEVTLQAGAMFPGGDETRTANPLLMAAGIAGAAVIGMMFAKLRD
jgi:hypothetical protein